MANSDLLQTFLQLHLVTDTAAFSNLPSVINSLSSSSLESSPHLAKFTNRVNSLIRSREPGTRWAGITLALYTSRLSRSILISNAQNWVSVVLPMLSRNESLVVWKASIRLIAFVFASTTNLAEFQRHVVTPNVPKFSSALLSLAEKQSEEELKVLCLDTLATMVPLYPSLHRQMSSQLSSTSLNFLNGSHTFTPASIASSASRLHACLHVTGGKVGATTLWRKSVDETVAFCSSSLATLRSTYASENQSVVPQTDPLVAVPLNFDRLYCGVELLCHLLRAKVERPVPVATQSLVNLCVGMLKVTKDGAIRDDADTSLRTMEASIAPNIRELGCLLVACLAKCVQRRLAPHLTRILGTLVYQLEQPLLRSERVSIIKILPDLFSSCLPPHEVLLCGRIVKTILPTIANLLSEKAAEETIASGDVGSKKGKKRARGYEGDEVFKVGRSILCETAEDSEHVLAALDALSYLLRVPKIPAYLQSLSSRLLLSLLLLLPKLPADAVAHDPAVKDRILRKVKETCIELTVNSSAALCKSLPLVVSAIAEEDDSANDPFDSSNQDRLLVDLMLHPRLPPLLRPLPALDAIALWQSEEGAEERNARESLGLRTSEVLSAGGETHDMGVARTVGNAQHTIHPVHSPMQEVQPAVEQPLPSIVSPAELLVVQPSAAVSSLPEQVPQSIAGPTVPQVNEESQDESIRLPTSPRPEQQEEHQLQVMLPERQPDVQPIQPQPQLYHHSEPSQMIVDSEEEGEDVEMPVLDPASPTDSEVDD